jgi:diacylglycerol kinase (ATP)
VSRADSEAAPPRAASSQGPTARSTRPPGAGSVRVIWNVNAGNKAGVSTNSVTLETMRDLMTRHGLGDDLVASESEEQAREAASEAVRAGIAIVVAAGGDGTVGVVARELLDSETALGVLPLGSVMNIGRMLGLSRDLEEAAADVERRRTRRIDVGRVDDVVFFEAASVGMNAAIFKEAVRFDAGEYGSLFRGLFVMLRYRPARMRIHLDDEVVETRALIVTVANGRYTGIGFTVAPSARLDDGLFDVRVFRHFSKLDLVRHFWSIAFGRRAYAPHVRTYRSKRVLIDSARPLPARADARDLGTTPVEFVVWPAALKVVTAGADSRARGSREAPG